MHSLWVSEQERNTLKKGFFVNPVLLVIGIQGTEKEFRGLKKIILKYTTHSGLLFLLCPLFGVAQSQIWALLPTGLSLDWGRTPPVQPEPAPGGLPVCLHRKRAEYTTHQTPKMVCRRTLEHFNTLIQETAVPGTGMYMTDLSARDNTGLKGRLGRTRRCALRQAAVVCFWLFFCLFLLYCQKMD